MRNLSTHSTVVRGTRHATTRGSAYIIVYFRSYPVKSLGLGLFFRLFLDFRFNLLYLHFSLSLNGGRF
jgi:hypothetical protein